MVEKRKTYRKGTAGRRVPVRRKKRNGGHPFLLFLFFLIVVSVAALTVNHPFKEAVPAQMAANTTIHHLFNDREKDTVSAPKISKDKEGQEGNHKEQSQSLIEEFMNKLKGVTAEKENRVTTETASTPREKEDEAEKESMQPAVEKTAPEKAPAANKTMPARASAVKGRLAVVIDDAGLDLDSQRIYERIGVPFTLAVMPNKLYTSEAAAEWTRHGMPVILHQPMESISGAVMEDKTILTSMDDVEIRTMLKESLAQVPQAVGINNHQGSKATTDGRVMGVIMNELSHRGLFFFDSRTNSVTEADKAAASYGVLYARNELFVDNSADESEIRSMIQEAADRAKAQGSYIVIGHCRPHTAAAFRDMVPQLRSQGIEFVFVSSLLH